MTPCAVPNLSQISTIWSDVFAAHTQGDEASRALNDLAQRYLPAIYGYIRGTLRNEHDAADLTQKFALKLCEGKFAKASPERGRFRNYIRTAVDNLITDHYRGRGMPNVPEGAPEPIAPEVPPAGDFDQRWSEETLNRAWDALAEADPNFHVVLKLKLEQKLRSAEIARRLTEQTGKPATEAGVRKTLQRANEKLANLLIDEVGRSIRSTDLTQIEEELRALGLHEYCRDEIAKRRKW
jgi:RNA polymerase sigma factor (sigma-70 family)